MVRAEQARVHTLGFHIWAERVEEMHTVLSRVMEKTVAYSMAALWHVLAARGHRCSRSLRALVGRGQQLEELHSHWDGGPRHARKILLDLGSVELRGTQAFQEPVGRRLRGALSRQTSGVLAADAGGCRRRSGGLPSMQSTGSRGRVVDSRVSSHRIPRRQAGGSVAILSPAVFRVMHAYSADRSSASTLLPRRPSTRISRSALSTTSSRRRKRRCSSASSLWALAAASGMRTVGRSS